MSLGISKGKKKKHQQHFEEDLDDLDDLMGLGGVKEEVAPRQEDVMRDTLGFLKKSEAEKKRLEESKKASAAMKVE